jgi:hypothetical protein
MLIAPLFSLVLLASGEPVPVPVPPAPAVEAMPTPAATPAPTPMVFERRVGRVYASCAPNGAVRISPGPLFLFTPGADESGDLPRWIEMALPSGSRHEFSARSETLITVPRGIALELENLMGDITVDAWDKDVVRIVAAHDRRDRMRARVVVVRGKGAELRQRLEALRDQAEAARERAEALRDRAEESRDRAEAPHERAEASLEREARRVAERVADRHGVQALLEKGTLQIETLNRQGIPATVDYTITVPRWMALRLSGMDTDISVDGVRGAIAAESIRGDVKVRGGRGPLQMSSVEGTVRAFDCQGDLEASSINNDVELDEVDGMLVVESVNGDIHIGRVKSQDVEASSVNGTVVYGGAFQPRGRYRLASHAGNLVVGVPVGAGVDVSVATFMGGFRSGFPVQVGPWRKGQKFNFVLGTGGSSLELESFQGLIELLRPEDVPAAPSAPTAPEAPKGPKPPKNIKVHRAPTPPTPPDAPDHKEDS